MVFVCLSFAATVAITCGGGDRFRFGQDASTSTSTSGSAPAMPCSDSGFTIDGLFTGFVAPSSATMTSPFALSEWAGVPSVRGKYTYMYMSACSTGSSYVLYFINDWYTNAKGPIDAQCYNRFDFFDPGSQDAVELRVYGDHHVVVLENGVSAAWAAKGAAGFSSSPNVLAAHSLFEFQLELPWKYQATQMSASDPCSASPPPPPPPPPNAPAPPSVGEGCEDPTYMIDEPTTVQLAFGASGLTSQIAPSVPRATGLDKYDAQPGDRVVLRGRDFGASPGLVAVDGRDAQVLMWTDSRIQIVVPQGVSPNANTKIATANWSVDGPRISGPTFAH